MAAITRADSSLKSSGMRQEIQQPPAGIADEEASCMGLDV